MPSTFTALADPHRRAMLGLMLERPRAVGELVERLGLSQPGTSKHLRVLREAGLVSDRRDGTRRLYRVAPQGVAELRAYFDGFWDDVLSGFKEKIEGGAS